MYPNILKQEPAFSLSQRAKAGSCFFKDDYALKRKRLSSRQPIFVNLKSNTMKNIVQM